MKCEKVSWTIDLALDLEVEISEATKEPPVESPCPVTSIGLIQKDTLQYAWPVQYPNGNIKPPSLIEHFFRQEQLTKSNYYNCESCKFSNALKRFYLLEPGDVLTIVIKRFKGLNKDCTHLPFEEEIDIAGVCLRRVAEEGQSLRSTKYKLASVIIHEGGSASQGHYICCVCIDECWVVFNDEKITQTSWERVRNMQAYILLYKIIE